MRIGNSATLTLGLAAVITCNGLPRMVSQVHVAAGGQHPESRSADGIVRIHTACNFSFMVDATMAIAAPLFGADRERAWAPGWNPTFIWPTYLKDQRGAVFTVTRGEMKSVWITTADDPENGLFQYAYVTPGVVATLITVKLTPQGSSTRADVRYERTSLSVTANDIVHKMADHDAQSGPEWSAQINEYLAASRK